MGQSVIQVIAMSGKAVVEVLYVATLWHLTTQVVLVAFVVNALMPGIGLSSDDKLGGMSMCTWQGKEFPKPIWRSWILRWNKMRVTTGQPVINNCSSCGLTNE